MRTLLLATTAALVGIAGCASTTELQQCRAAANQYGLMVADLEPSSGTWLSDTTLVTYGWAATTERPAVLCEVVDGKVISLTAGDRTLIKR